MLTPSRPRSAPPTLRWLRSSQAPSAGRGRGAGRPGGTAFWSGREIRRGVTGKLVRVPGSLPVCFPVFGQLLPGSFPPYLSHGPLDPSLCHRPPWSSRRRPRGNDGGSGMRTEAAGRGRLGQACCDPVAARRAPSGACPRRFGPAMRVLPRGRGAPRGHRVSAAHGWRGLARHKSSGQRWAPRLSWGLGVANSQNLET